MTEIWKPIKDFEGSYEISNLGRVRSLDRYRYCKSKNTPNLFKGKILKQRKDKDGYLIVNLKIHQKSHMKKIHRLVASAFIVNPNNYKDVNHKDGIKINNHISNLEWCTAAENNRHRTQNLLVRPVLNKKQVMDILKNCKPLKNQKNKSQSVSFYAKKYQVNRGTIYGVLKRNRMYLEALCK